MGPKRCDPMSEKVAPLWPPAGHFRSSPINGHCQGASACRKRTIPDFMHRSIASCSISHRHCWRREAPQTVIFRGVEGAKHRERHGLNPGLDGRLRHRREQRRVVSRRLRTSALAGGSDALRLVDADSEDIEGTQR